MRVGVGPSSRAVRAVMVLVPMAFLGIFFVYPVVTIVGRGLWPGGSVDLSPVGNVLTDPSLREIVWFTVWQAAISTVLTLVIGIPGAAALTRFRFRGSALVRALVVVPFVLPTVVVGTAFLALGIGPSVAAILVAHMFFNYAVVVRTVGGLWSHLDPRQEDAARVLGASRLRTFWTVTLPALRPAIAAAGAIVFLFTFTSFGVILVLGGPTRSTLETEIYRQTAQLLDLQTAAALSIVQLVAVLVLLVVTGRLQGRRPVALSLRGSLETARRARTAGERCFLGANLALAALLLGGPVLVLVLRSFDTPTGYGLEHYRALSSLHSTSVLFVPPEQATWNSLAYACAATAMAVVIGGLAAFSIVHDRRAGAVDAAITLPLGVSAVTVGFGFLITLDAGPLDLRTSWILVPIAQALVAIPFVVRLTTPVLRAIDPRLREAATLLGATPRRVWREIDLPIASRALAVAAGFAFAIALGEFGATIFLARPDRPTLPVVIYRLLGAPGPASFGAAMAASTILLLLAGVSVLVVDRARVADAGVF
jgi:thiamine transport system permease protein